MSAQIYVRTVAVLDRLAADLSRFGGHAAESLLAAASEANTTLRWFEQHLATCISELDAAEAAVDEARADLRNCRDAGSGDDDEEPDCSECEDALADARRRARAAGEAVRRARQAERRVREAVHLFERETRECADQSAAGFASARAVLAGHHDRLREYLDIGFRHEAARAGDASDARTSKADRS